MGSAKGSRASCPSTKKGLDAGFIRYLTKPIVVSELMDALDLALETAAL